MGNPGRRPVHDAKADLSSDSETISRNNKPRKTRSASPSRATGNANENSIASVKRRRRADLASSDLQSSMDSNDHSSQAQADRDTAPAAANGPNSEDAGLSEHHLKQRSQTEIAGDSEQCSASPAGEHSEHIARANRQAGRSDTAKSQEYAEEYAAKASDVLEDASEKRYSKAVILDTIMSYKKDSRNFFWGDLQKNCSRMNRRHDDRWYAWTKEMMENVDENEERMKSIVVKHTHSKIQEVCREIGGDAWNLKCSDKIKRLMRSVKQIEKMVRTKGGMRTCWGRMAYDGVFKNKLRSQNIGVKDGQKKGRVYDVMGHIKLKDRRWKRHYKGILEKKDISKLYDRN